MGLMNKVGAVFPIRLLIINPNTTSRITTLLETHARTIVGPEVVICAVTARFGAPYIACEASYAVAGHATLDAWAAALAPEQPPPHAVLIGCFGDPGLLALRETSRVRVTGLAEASFVEASGHGPFAIVTGGQRWKPMLERLAQTLGYGQFLAGVHTVTPSGAQLAEDPAAARVLLAKACRDAASHFKAKAVIVGGAGLAGVAADIQGEVDIPLIDSVLAGTRHALKIASQTGSEVSGQFDFSWHNVSPELAALGSRRQ
jgi:allantoin racemase